jgi:hypothetical protein
MADPMGGEKAVIVAGRLSPLQLPRDRAELLQGRLEVVGDLLGQHVGLWEALGVLQALVPQPRQVEGKLVPLGEFLVGVAPPAC